jgi:hypothetical protein
MIQSNWAELCISPSPPFGILTANRQIYYHQVAIPLHVLMAHISTDTCTNLMAMDAGASPRHHRHERIEAL